MADSLDDPPVRDPLAALERHLIGAYLARAGHDFTELSARSDAEARALLAAASQYASVKLSEVDARGHYLQALRGEH